MPTQIFNCRFHALIDLDLLNAGVALECACFAGSFWFSLATNERPDVITLVVLDPCD
jgi:hypothetical protein